MRDAVLSTLLVGWTATGRQYRPEPAQPCLEPVCTPPLCSLPLQPPRPWSRYERLSFSMLGVTWGILVLAVAALHFGNYHLDTKTSSTSGSHAGFYESARSLKSDSPAQESSR